MLFLKHITFIKGNTTTFTQGCEKWLPFYHSNESEMCLCLFVINLKHLEQSTVKSSHVLGTVVTFVRTRQQLHQNYVSLNDHSSPILTWEQARFIIELSSYFSYLFHRCD